MAQVFVHKTDAMRQLQLLVARGHTRWTGGQIHPSKLMALCLKFEDRYGINRTSQQRWRAKAQGEASSHLVLWQAEPDQINWWLLVTPGEGLVNDLEQLQEVRRTRIQLTGYELLQMPRTGRLAAWTWRMTPDTLKTWLGRLQAVIRHHDLLGLEQALYSLKRVPGFAQSRRQAFQLVQYAQNEWKRSQRTEWPYPGIFIGWVGRFKQARQIPVSAPKTRF